MTHEVRVPVLAYLAKVPADHWVVAAKIADDLKLLPADVNSYMQWAAQAKEIEVNDLGEVRISTTWRYQFEHAQPALPRPAEGQAVGKGYWSVDAAIQSDSREREASGYFGTEKTTIKEGRGFFSKVLLGPKEVHRERKGQYREEREKENTRKFGVRTILIIFVAVLALGGIAWLWGRGGSEDPGRSGETGSDNPKLPKFDQNEPKPQSVVPPPETIPELSDFRAADLIFECAAAVRAGRSEEEFWAKWNGKQVAWLAKIYKDHLLESDDMVHLVTGGADGAMIDAFFSETDIAASVRQLPPDTPIVIQGEIKMPYNHFSSFRLLKCKYYRVKQSGS
ncbi:MAG TPA: hypothetical protein VFG04_17750 [Planctomycetaceae bacterium]|jgi:hypothetical protein|nr:hypothetical protein [Planctomycetaceae bacterium]